MKTDREIADEAWAIYRTDRTQSVAEIAISLARQYGALPAPAAPLSFVEQAAIAAMHGIIMRANSGTYGDISEAAVAHAICLEAALKKGGAA